MLDIAIAIKGAAALSRSLKVAKEQEFKNLNSAIRGEAFRLRNILKDDIRSGAPGGRRFKPLSIMRASQRSRNTPLYRLAGQVKYHVNKTNNSVTVGFTGPKVEEKWKSIALKQQEGFDKNVTKGMRRYFVREGIKRGRSKKTRGGQISLKFARKSNMKIRAFMLRRETTRLHTPARPIIAPFWAAHEHEVFPNIRRNFRLKQQGKKF